MQETEDIVARLQSRAAWVASVSTEQLLYEAATTIATLRAELEVLRAAADVVLSHVEGSLPIRGWLRDTDASREALGRLRAAIDAAKADKEGA